MQWGFSVWGVGARRNLETIIKTKYTENNESYRTISFMETVSEETEEQLQK